MAKAQTPPMLQVGPRTRSCALNATLISFLFPLLFTLILSILVSIISYKYLTPGPAGKGIKEPFSSSYQCAIDNAPPPPFSRAPTGGRAINNRQSASLFFPFILFPSFLELTARTLCRRYTRNIMIATNKEPRTMKSAARVPENSRNRKSLLPEGPSAVFQQAKGLKHLRLLR